jgi:hypothetical protein
VRYNGISMQGILGRNFTTVAHATVLASAILASTVAPGAETVIPHSALRLDVLLTVSPQLSGISRRTLIGEAERIWGREQVNLAWPAATGGVDRPSAPLRVLVIARPQAASVDDGRWPVAELVPHAEDRALAIASIAGAQRVVNEAARYAVLDFPGMEDYRVGLVLGRAVAHEIGHFLLATGTHAEQGLMRASVGAVEFASMGFDTFRLDEDASRWIRQRLAVAGPAVRTLRTAGFSYTRR